MNSQKQQIVELMQEVASYRRKNKLCEKAVEHFMKATDDASLVIISLQSDLIELLKKEVERLREEVERLREKN